MNNLPPKTKVKSIQELNRFRLKAIHVNSNTHYIIDNEISLLDFLAQCKLNNEIGQWKLYMIPVVDDNTIGSYPIENELTICSDGRIKNNKLPSSINDSLDILF